MTLRASSRRIGNFVLLTGIKVQITVAPSIVIGRLCCYLHFCPGQNDKCPEVTTNRCDFSDRLLRISQFEHSQIVEGDREPLVCARAAEGTTGAWVQTQVYQGPGLFYSTPPAWAMTLGATWKLNRHVSVPNHITSQRVSQRLGWGRARTPIVV